MGDIDNEIKEEIREIGGIISQVHLLDTVRREVNASISSNTRALVLGGEYADNPNYDVVIKHNGDEKLNNKLTRRLRKALSDVEVSKLDSVVNRVMLGVRFSSRRGQKNQDNE